MRFADGFARRSLAKRLAAGKEDPERQDERIGIASMPRPDGPLIWMHAASVGESQSMLELGRKLLEERPAINCMITTGTITSAKALEGKLPARMFHQYVPVDTRNFVDCFLEHWHPELALFIESELWPALLTRTYDHNIPLVLVNAHMSEKSYRGWRWLRGMAEVLLNRFEHVLVQDDDSATYMQKLGLEPEKTNVIGSLTEGIPPLLHNEVERKSIAASIAGRPIWLAASTHANEEELASKAHKTACRAFPDLVMLLAPRYPERGDEIAQMLTDDGWVVAQRSRAQTIENRTDIYLADTIGEMGLWYRLAPLSFIGGSLVEIGGHSPFEPAALGSAILHGPHISNFAEPYARLAGANACVKITCETLGETLAEMLVPENTAMLASNAWGVFSDGAEVIDTVLEILLPYFPEGET